MNNVPLEINLLVNWLKERDINLRPLIVDIGAGDGEYYSNSEYFIEKLAWDAVLIDGLPSNCEKLADKYLGDSGIKGDVQIHDLLVSDKVEEVFFEEDPKHWSLSKIQRDKKPNNRTSTLSDIFIDLRISTPGILSIDIEGMDTKVLFEFFMNCNIRPQVIIIEGNEFKDMIAQSEFLRSSGYDFVGGVFPNQIFIKGSKNNHVKK